MKFMRLAAVLDARARSNSSHYEDIADGTFVPPVRIGPRAKAYLDNEVEAIIRARLAGKSDAEIRELVQRLVAERGEGA